MKLRLTILAAALAAITAHAADPPPGVVGKNGWLFYRYEAVDGNVTADARTTLQLIARLSRVLAANDVAVMVTLVPVKMRVYAKHLPADFPISQYMKGQYQQFAQGFRAQKIPFADLDTAFLESPKRDSDTPLFLRLDTHWSPTGTMVAAEAIKAAIDADPALSPIVASIPAAKYRLREAPAKPSPAIDLVAQLPASAPKFEREVLRTFVVDREKAAAGGLLDDAAGPAITLLGSSYSSDWTTFPSALRHALQRDVLSIAVPANQGSWVGMETYLRDDSFQKQPPKLIVWELPERDMHAPPNFKYREARYVLDNNDWLLRAAAWATPKCTPATPTLKATTGKLAKPGPSAEGDFVEIAFSRPLDRLEYVSARLTTYGSSQVRIEASGAGVTARKYELAVAGDDEAHNFKTPPGKGYDKLRITPGKAHQFRIEDVRVCRQMEGLLD